MQKNLLIGIGVLAIIGLIAAYFLKAPQPALPEEFPGIGQQEAQMQSYESPTYGLSFAYPLGYYLKEREAPEERPQLSLVMVEDTQENRDVIEGRATEAREEPTAITVDVYPNPDRLPAEDWVRADTNWTVRTSEAAPIGRGSVTGVTYSWSGLYEGKSVVISEGMRTYVFSVTWLTPEDAILASFDQVLASVEVSAP
jgi:hypothetical protein